jgi:ABC-type nickel/cobalt efflux system permease component RcnA
MMNSKMLEIFEAPKWLRRLSECTGLALSLSWLGYAGYVSVANQLGWPASDEQLDIASVAILAFAAGWVCVRLSFGLIRRAHRRMVPNG